jgi:hypothetical protein
MARATRSSTQSLSSQPPPTTTLSNKRKRSDIVDADDKPAKHLRTDPPLDAVHTDNRVDDQCPSLENAGDLPIALNDAQKILDILEMCVLCTITLRGTVTDTVSGSIHKVY